MLQNAGGGHSLFNLVLTGFGFVLLRCFAFFYSSTATSTSWCGVEIIFLCFPLEAVIAVPADSCFFAFFAHLCIFSFFCFFFSFLFFVACPD